MKKTQRKKKPAPRETSRPFSKSKIQAILFFLIAFLLPTQLGKHFFLPFSYITGVRVDYLAPTLYLTDILAFALIFLNFKSLPAAKGKKTILVISALLLLNFLFAFSKPLFFYRFVKLLEVAGLFAVFAKQYGTYKKEIISGLALSALVQTPLVISQFVQRHSLQGVWYLLGERMFSLSTPGIAKAFLQGKEFLRPYGTFSHPNSLAGFFLLVELFFLFNRDITNTVFKYAVVFFSSLLVFVSFSKNAILAYFIFNLVFALREKRCRLCVAASLLTSLALSGIVLTAQTDILSVSKRLTLIAQSLTIIAAHPVTGVGLGSYLLAQASFPIRYPYFFLQPVHNVFLLLAAELGIPFFALLVYFGWKFLRGATFPLVVLTGALLMTGMFDHYSLTLQQNLLLVPVLFGAMLYNKNHGR